MRYVIMDDVQPGMILGRDIYDFAARTLLSEGKELSQELIRKLKERGYPGVYIDDDWSRDIHVEEIISMELRTNAAMSLRDLDMDATMDVSGKIVEQISQAKVLSLDIMDLKSYDDYIYRHSVNVAVLSTIIGMGVGYDTAELKDLCLSAMCHDLGKILIDQRILNKPGKLNAMENEVVRRHPQLSYDMLYDRWNIPARVKAGVLCHHENEDGSGYPNGLPGDKIHPFAKIIHVADVYDALSSKRPYKEACSYSESFEYLMGGCGTLFDQKIVEIFANYVTIYPKGMMVELSDGQQAVVMENNKNDRVRPKVKLLDGQVLDLRDTAKNRNITIVKQSGTHAMVADEIEENEKGRNQKTYHILAVDDMVSSLQQIKGILAGKYKISMVKSGQQALEFLKKKKPDLILMDVAMPDKNGIETVKEIRERFPEHIPVIFVSALHDIQTVLECRNIQAEDYILKPFEPSYLKERIKSVLGEEDV